MELAELPGSRSGKYMQEKINKLETHSKNKNIMDLYNE
jgi:hypothetical protein